MNIVNTNIINEINIRLSKIINLDLFKKALEESDCMISGDFILQCILGEYWDVDIDIYICQEDIETSAIGKFLIDECCYYSSNKDTFKFKIFNKTKYIFKIVNTYPNQPRDIKLFDFDILKNYYYKETLKISPVIYINVHKYFLLKYISMSDLVNVIAQDMQSIKQIDISNLRFVEECQYKKYKSLGFTFIYINY